MSDVTRAACFPLSQLRTSTSAGRVWLKSGVMPLPDLFVIFFFTIPDTTLFQDSSTLLTELQDGIAAIQEGPLLNGVIWVYALV